MGAWETNDNSHRITLRASSEFSAGSFRRKDHQNGVVAVLGKHTSDNAVLLVQSVIFDKEVFAEQSDAKKWWGEHTSNVDKSYDSRSGKPLDSKSIRELGGINKRVVAVHAAPESTGELYSAVTSPNEAQLEAINRFTRSPKEADQLAVFPVLACNDVVDRDVDQFTTDTVKGFLELEGPLSPIGKSFMVGHDYSKLPVGRVFDGEIAKKSGVTHLKLWTYIPNTEQYKSYLENVDFGVYWAVSVGVMLGGSTCSVGKEHDWGWHPYMCSEGHMKGQRYDPDGERDKFGMPVVEKDGDMAWRKLMDPTDFYELSQVYLGAQYMAEFEKGIGAHAAKGLRQQKRLAFKGVETAASLHEREHITILSSKEAATLPPLFPSQSKAASAAASGIAIKQGDDGLYTWTDNEGLVWTFSMESEEELCLGRTKDFDPDQPRDENGRWRDVLNGGDGDGSDGLDGSDSEGSADSPAGNQKVGTNASGVIDEGQKTAWGEPGPDGTVRATYAEEQEIVATNPNWEIAWRDNFWGIEEEADEEGNVEEVRPEDYDSGYVTAYVGPVDEARDLVSGHDQSLKSLQEVQEWIDGAIRYDQELGEGDDLGGTLGITRVPTSNTSRKRGERHNEQRTPKEDDLSKQAVMQAAMAAKLPTAVVEAVEKVDDSSNGLGELLTAAASHIDNLQKQVEGMATKAAAGDAYLKEIRAAAIHWYVMSQKGGGENRGVNTSRIERLLDMAGEDVELLKELRDQYHDNARARFPEAVRRSTFPENVNERSPLGEEVPKTFSTEGVKRIHG